jgi:hypothetical protein
VRAAPRRTAAASEGTVAGSAGVERKACASLSAFWAVRSSVIGGIILVMKRRKGPLTTVPRLTMIPLKISPPKFSRLCAATAAGDKVQVYCRWCCMAGAVL